MLPKYQSSLQLKDNQSRTHNYSQYAQPSTQKLVSTTYSNANKGYQRSEQQNQHADVLQSHKKYVVTSPKMQQNYKNSKDKNTPITSGDAYRKHQSRNQTKIMATQDPKHAKSNYVVNNHPLMSVGLGSLKNIQNQEKKQVNEDVPQETVEEDLDMNESDDNRAIRQPWISAQKREINMVSPGGNRSINESKNYYGDFKSSYYANDGDNSLLDNQKRKPPIGSKRQIQRSASPVLDNALIVQINNKGTATQQHTRGQSPVANITAHIMNNPNFTIKSSDSKRSKAPQKDKQVPNTSRLSVNTISQASNTKSQSKYFQHTHISVGRVYQVNNGGRDMSPNTNYLMTQSAVDASHYSTHQPNINDMVIEENNSGRKANPNASKDVKKVYQYVIPKNMSKARQSRNTLHGHQQSNVLKTMAYNSKGSTLNSKKKTSSGTLHITENHVANQNFSIDFTKHKNFSGVESKQTLTKNIQKMNSYKNQIPKTTLNLECSRTPNDGPYPGEQNSIIVNYSIKQNEQNSIIVNQSIKQNKTVDQKKRMDGHRYHHMPNKSQASLGSIPSNSSLTRQFNYNNSKIGVKMQKSNAPQHNSRPFSGIIKKVVGGQENPYSQSIQSDNRKFVNTSEIFHVIPNQGQSRGNYEIQPGQNNTSVGVHGNCEYLHTYQEFEIDEQDSNSLDQPSVQIYSTRNPSQLQQNQGKHKSPTFTNVNSKKFQTTKNTVIEQSNSRIQQSNSRKQQVPNMKMKSCSPRNVFNKLYNQERMGEVNNFMKTMIVKKSTKPTNVVLRGVQERLRQKYNLSRSPTGRENKKQSKIRSNASGNGSPVVDFSKTKFLTFANQIRKAVNDNIVSNMTESKAIQYVNDEKNQETLYSQINVHHFDIWVNKMKDRGTLLHFLCHQNKMPNLIDILLKKKVQVTASNSKKMTLMKKPLVDKDTCTKTFGYSCIQLASFGLYNKMIEKLLLCKINANHKDLKNRTALWYLVEMYQKEAQYKFPNKKVINQIQEILELIAPFCEESLKIEDQNGDTPVSIAKNRQLKELLNEIFQNYHLPNIRSKLIKNKEEIDDSSSMSNTDEFQVNSIQIIQHKKVKSKLCKTDKEIKQWNSSKFIIDQISSQDKSIENLKINKTYTYTGDISSIAIIPVEVQRSKQKTHTNKEIKQMQIDIFEPEIAFNQNLVSNHKNKSIIDSANTTEGLNYVCLEGQPIEECKNQEDIDETQTSFVNNDELNQQIIQAQEKEKDMKQSYQQAQQHNRQLKKEEDLYTPSGVRTFMDEERGEQSDIGAVHHDYNNYNNYKNNNETSHKERIKLLEIQKQVQLLDQNISRSANQMSKNLLVSNTVGAGVSRNNFTEEEGLSPMVQLDKIQTVETPFKMKDVIKNEKFERISSLQYGDSINFSEKARNNRQIMKNKVIGNSFLGSSNINESESKFANDEIGPNHFRAHQLLGTGSFGEVFLVEEIATKELYAMKVLSKEKINEQFLLKYAFAEKQIMAEMTKINHPYIVKIKYTFQTTENLFMIMQFCSGGDLSQYLELEGCFDEQKSKTYICEIICAIEALHKHNIIFRDLKPDNIVLDADGHALLTDFGLSRQGIPGNMNGADSFCGSYAYLAPEMIKKCGHGKAVDWYLIGVVLYELLTGLPPFYDDDKEILFKNIQNNKLVFPDDNEVQLSDECKDIMEKLLTKDPYERLGNIGGVREIKMHPFFNGVDWKKVTKRESKVPPAYLSEMALDIIAKQPFMLKDHPKTHGDHCPPGHPMYIEGWEMNMTSYSTNNDHQQSTQIKRMSHHFQ